MSVAQQFLQPMLGGNVITLTDSLISWYKLNGDLTDSYGSNDLTDHGTITFGVGKQAQAADFEIDDSQYADSASSDFDTGDIDFTFAVWVNVESLAANSAILSKVADATHREFQLNVQTGGQIRLLVSNSGNLWDGDFTTTGTIGTGSWHLIIAWHDSVNNQLAIQIDNNTPETSAYSGGLSAQATANFQVSGWAGTNSLFDGLVDELGFWKKVLSSDERNLVWNGGAGDPGPPF